VERDLCVIGARLNREVATALGLDQLITIERRHVDQRLRAAGGKAVAVGTVLAEQTRTETERHGQSRRQQAEGVATVSGRRAGVGAERLGCLPSCHSGSRRGPGLQERHDVGRLLRGQIKRGEVGVALRRRDDAALVLSPEGEAAGRRLHWPGDDTYAARP
jgi:hypothetical protein